MKSLFFYSRAPALSERNELNISWLEAPSQLSNFSECEITIRVPIEYRSVSVKLPSVEHAYQMEKYLFVCSTNEEKKLEVIKLFTDPMNATSKRAKRLGSTLEHYGLILQKEEWSEVKREIMKRLVFQRIESSARLQRFLREVRDHQIELIHSSASDDYWGCVVSFEDGKHGEIVSGRNELGKIYHEYIREKL